MIFIFKRMILIVLTFFLTSIFPDLTVYAEPIPIDQIYLTPGGETIGIEVQTKVIVVDSYAVKSGTKLVNPAAESGIRKGDIILNLDGRQIDSIEDVKAVLRTYKNSHKKELTAIIRRDGQNLKTKITPVVTNDGTISLGLYLKDHILGIGTLTFTYKDRFGALGHQIKDNSGLVDERLNDEGVIKRAIVTNIVKGKKGSPGEKKATMFPKEIGIIQENTMTGIFGILKEDISHRHAMPIKAREEVRTGAAQILTVIKGDKVEAFDIEIIEVKNQPTKDIKGLKIRVVDDRLLSETGGIIQGMSGSPIIQDGRIIGAVTHVLLNDQTTGYGVFIEFMLEDLGIEISK